jgi:hypothetical protein
MIEPESERTYAIRMRKKLTITLDEKVYKGLHKHIGEGRISQFIEDLVRPHVLKDAMDQAFREMAADKEREAEALEWIEALAGDIDDEKG